MKNGIWKPQYVPVWLGSKVRELHRKEPDYEYLYKRRSNFAVLQTHLAQPLYYSQNCPWLDHWGCLSTDLGWVFVAEPYYAESEIQGHYPTKKDDVISCAREFAKSLRLRLWLEEPRYINKEVIGIRFFPEEDE